MVDSEDLDAWNNFVLNSQPKDYLESDAKYFAALAKNYMNGALSGGINSFLTNSWEIEGQQVLIALKAIGAVAAAEQFAKVLARLGEPVLAATQIDRWNFLVKYWPENDEGISDLLSDEAEKSIMIALENHVQTNEEFYRNI